MAENTKVSVKEATQIAKMFESKISFQKGAYGAYRLLLKNPKHFRLATKHMVNPLKHSFEVIEKEAKKYDQAYAFQKESKWAYCAAQQNGWLESVCSHMKKRFAWDLPTAKKEAKKYKQMKKFRKESRGAYNFLKKHGNKTLHEACSHMVKPFRWTPASALKFAKKFKNRQALRDANAGCMTYICLNSLTEKAFAHMEEVIIQSEKNELNDFLAEFSLMLQKKKITFNFHKEYKPVAGERYRVDLLIELLSLNKKIAIEYKSDRSYWNKEKIKKQTEFYQSHLCKIGVKKTYLISTKGKYGISKDQFFNEFFKGLKNE